MELNKYQEQAMTTCLPTSHNFYYALGLLHEESGELQGKVDKAVRKGKAVINANQLNLVGTTQENAELMDAIIKETGDVMWAVACIADVLGINLETICKQNLEKLAQRKANGTIDGKGDGVTKAERA